MANRGSQKRRTAERKARQSAGAKRVLLVEFARKCGARAPEDWSDRRLADYVMTKRPNLRKAVATSRSLEASGKNVDAMLAGMATEQAMFLRMLRGAAR